MASAGPEFDALVTAVKDLLRRHPNNREEWSKYTILRGNGTRDPARHKLDFLQGFVQHIQSGVALPDQSNTSVGLAQQIRDLRGKDQNAREAWLAYTDAQGGGTRDPAKHSSEFLANFIALVQSGNPMAGINLPAPGGKGAARYLGGPGGGGSIPGMESAVVDAPLSDGIKSMQKRSVHFRNVWGQYCAAYADGFADPARHDANYLLSFLDAVAQQACMCAGIATAEQLQELQQSAMNGTVESPAKRQRTQIGASGGITSVHDMLVQQLKLYQRQGTEQKNLWCAYADTYLGGTRDPARHAENVLQEFITNHHVPSLEALGGCSGTATGALGAVEAGDFNGVPAAGFGDMSALVGMPGFTGVAGVPGVMGAGGVDGFAGMASIPDASSLAGLAGVPSLGSLGNDLDIMTGMAGMGSVGNDLGAMAGMFGLGSLDTVGGFGASMGVGMGAAATQPVAGVS